MEAKFLYDSETISGRSQGVDPCLCAIYKRIAHQFLYDAILTRTLATPAEAAILAWGDTFALARSLALSRHLRLHAFVVGSRSDQQAMVRALEASSMRPIIDRHFPLEELVEAFRYRESGRHFGKVVIDI